MVRWFRPQGDTSFPVGLTVTSATGRHFTSSLSEFSCAALRRGFVKKSARCNQTPTLVDYSLRHGGLPAVKLFPHSTRIKRCAAPRARPLRSRDRDHPDDASDWLGAPCRGAGRASFANINDGAARRAKQAVIALELRRLKVMLTETCRSNNINSVMKQQLARSPS